LDEPVKVALVYGSTRKGRFCDTVARSVASQIAADSRFSLKTVDPAASEDEKGVTRLPSNEIASAQSVIEWADAVVVVTPEYNHGYPAPLKALIDSIGQQWHAKPVAFVSYGGVSGGLRAVEQLRQVFAELHAVTVRDVVSFASAWEQFDAGGTPLTPERRQKSMRTMLGYLHWWAVALRIARGSQPYLTAA
jgi:NAD(P)H-dependent FMN reductase